MELVGVSFARLACSAAFVSVRTVYAEGLLALKAFPEGGPRTVKERHHEWLLSALWTWLIPNLRNRHKRDR